MRTSAKIITALSVTGLAVVAGSAFTGAGLTTSGQAAKAQFIGGQVSQDVTGAVLEGLEYGFSDANTGKTSVNKVTLTFTKEASDKIARVTLTNAAGTSLTTEPIQCTQTGTVEQDGMHVLAAGATTVVFECEVNPTVTNVAKASVTVESVNA